MFEVKCDVKGCSTREMLAAPGGGLPPGWRMLAFDIIHATPRSANPLDGLVRSVKKMAGPEMAEVYSEFARSVMPTHGRMPFITHHVTKHMCARHPLPEFESEADGELVEGEDDRPSTIVIPPDKAP